MAAQNPGDFMEVSREETVRKTARRARIRAVSVLLLCFVAGTTDILSYLTLGNIFTSAMTGCAALLFLKLAGSHYAAVSRASVALTSYLLGCGLATRLQPHDRSRIGSPTALRRLMAGECLLLFMYVPIALTGSGDEKTYLLIFLSATAMGMQSIVARDLREPGISTVVLNPTMTSLGSGIMQVLLRQKQALPRQNRRHIGVLLAYAGGALLTALGLADPIAVMNLPPFGAAASVLLLFHYLCRREPEPDGLRR